MAAICTQCQAEFESKRADAKFCSANCRKKASRVTDNSVTDNVRDNVTDNLSVTTPAKPKNEIQPIHHRREVTHQELDALLDIYKPEQITKDLLNQLFPKVWFTFVPNWVENGFRYRDLKAARFL